MDADPLNMAAGLDDGEEDVCRICRLEADEENPMVHPCKCSGSVRFVHPDCLKSWLATSQKKSCEICGHRYTFSKVYPDDIPSTIPFDVYLRQFCRYVFSWILFIYRCWIVMAVWLIVLPLANMGGLRTFRWCAETTLSTILPTYSIASGNATSVNTTLHNVAQNATTFEITNQTTTDVLQVALETKLRPGLSLRIAKRLWRMYRGTTTPNVTILPPPTPEPAQVRGFLLFNSVDVPSPYYIFQGQILSIALAGTVVSFIFLREWYASYNWAQHNHVETTAIDEHVVPEEWVIRRGMAERKFTRLADGKMVPLSMSRREKREKWRLKALRKAKTGVELGEEESTEDEGGTANTVMMAPKRRRRATDEANTRPYAAADDAFLPAVAGEQGSAGPGPSTLASRAAASTSEDIPTDDHLSAEIEWLQQLVERAEGVRQARAKLAQGLTDDVAWKAPELLGHPKEGSEEVVDEEEGSQDHHAGASARSVAAETKSTEPDDIPPPSMEPEPPGAVEDDSAATVQSGAASASPALAADPTPADGSHHSLRALLPSIPTDRSAPSVVAGGANAGEPHVRLLRLIDQLSSDLDVLLDRREALHQDATALIDHVSQPGESRQSVIKEMVKQEERMKEAKIEADNASERLSLLLKLGERLRVLEPEISELLEGDAESQAEAKDMKGQDRVVEQAEEIEGVKAGTAGGERARANAPAQRGGAGDPAVSATEPSPSGDTSLGPSPEPSSRAVLPLFAPAALPWDRVGKTDMAPAEEGSTSSPQVGPSHSTSISTAQPGAPPTTSNSILGVAAPSSGRGPNPSSTPTDTNPPPFVNGNNDAGIAPSVAADKHRAVDARDEAAKRPKRRWDEIEESDHDMDDEMMEEEAAAEREAVAEWQKANGFTNSVVGFPTPAAREEVPEPDTEEGEVEDPVVPDAPEVVVEVEEDEAARAEDFEDFEALLDDEDEEEGGWVAEDWDQVLGVIGLTGPYSALIQNLTLAIVIMGMTMITCVLFPVTLGKIVLCMDLVRASLHSGGVMWRVCRKLLRWTRYLTDPIIDTVLAIAKKAIPKPVGTAFAAAEGILVSLVGLQQSTGLPCAVQSAGLLSRARKATGLLLFSSSHRASETLPDITIPIPQILAARFDLLPSNITLPNPWSPDLTERILDAFEALGNESYHAYEAHRAQAMRLATSEKLGDAVLCLALWYGFVLINLVSVAWLSERGVVKFSDGWKQSLRRCRLSIKLAIFLVLELVAFPLGAGALIGLSTAPLISSSSLEDRLAGMKDTAFGVIFITWLIGTMFMYGFAQVLAWCRSYCRPGALYFIRDPHDPKYSPVKEIINRPTMAQFRKLGISTVMYSILIWWVFGAVPWGITSVAPNTVLPLRLDNFGPITPIPFDYLFLLIAIPPTVYRIRPQHTLKKLLGVYWRTFERLLRLEHLLYADKDFRRVAEPTKPGPTETIIWDALDIPFRLLFGSYESDATLARVPAQDRVHLLSTNTKHGVRREGMFVLLTDKGQPKTPNDKLKMIRQDLIARKAERDPKVDFKIVHLPEKWRTRLHVFILLLLAGGGALLGMLLLGPIILGREILKGQCGQVHDGYSFLVGAYTIYGAILAGRRAFKITVSLNRASELRLASRQLLIKRYIRSHLRRALIVAVVYGVHPVLKGLIWELRVGLLVRYGLKHAVPVVHLWDAWALGSILNAIDLGTCGMFGPHRAAGGHRMHDIWRNPFSQPGWQIGFTLLPEFRSLAISLALPFLYSFCMIPIWGKKEGRLELHFRMAGMATWAMRALAVRIPTLSARWGRWRQHVIDAEYVVEERVENYQPEPEVQVEEVQQGGAVEGVDGGEMEGVPLGAEDTGSREVVLDGGAKLVVPADAGAVLSDTDDEDDADAGEAGTGEASEVEQVV